MKIFIIIVVLLILAILIMYNRIIKLRNKVKQAKSGIDVYLTQRFDLIPNLIECVKSYSKYEATTFEKITEMREKYNKEKNIKDGEELNREYNELLLKAEAYPELKASEQYLNLQKNLAKMENQLQAARRIYNIEVTNYNDAIGVFPTNLIAKMFNFKEADFFEKDFS